MNRIRKMEFYDLVSNIIVVFFALLNLFPLYWLVTSSFKTSTDIFRMPPDWWPQNFILNNFQELFRTAPALRWTFNSIFVSFATTFLLVAISCLSAYAFAKLQFKGKRILFVLLLSTLMVPKEIFLVPLFRMIIAFNWVNSYQAMIFPNLASAFGLFLLVGFFSAITNSIRDSGMLDGANEFTIFYKLCLPIAKPGIGALFILFFVQIWNDYLWQLVVTNSRDMRTLMVGVGTLMQELTPNFGLRMAGATVAAVPMIIIFVFFQSYFTRGITLGAVKE